MKSSHKRVITFLALVITSSLLLFFQNCGRNFSNMSPGNGEPYAGFGPGTVPFPDHGDPNVNPNNTSSSVEYTYADGSICADGSNVIARILVINQQAYLMRENCADRAALPLDSNLYSVSGSTLVFDSKTFVIVNNL